MKKGLDKFRNKHPIIKSLLVFGGCLLIYKAFFNKTENYDKGEIMLKLRSNAVSLEKRLNAGEFGIEEIDKINKKHGIKYIERIFKDESLPPGYDGELKKWYHLEFDEKVDTKKFLKEYSDLSSIVEAAQLDLLYKTNEGIISKIFSSNEEPNDPLFGKQWGMHRIQAVEARKNFGPAKNKVVIAVVDSGVYNHEDLQGMFYKKNGRVIGWNTIKNNEQWQDDNGHGTHVATIMSMVWNNKIGGAGVSQALIMPVKALTAQGYGTSEDLAKALIWAANQGAFAINNSWGSAFPTQIIQDSGEYSFHEKGVFLTAAAGNSGNNRAHYPASYKEFMAVGALNSRGERASFSTWGDFVEIAAPGQDIWAGFLKGYESLSGTSMATPFITAAGAEIKVYFPNATNKDVRKLLNDKEAGDLINTDHPIGGKSVNLLKLLNKTKKDLK